MHEKDHFQTLLADLCAAIPQRVRVLVDGDSAETVEVLEE